MYAMVLSYLGAMSVEDFFQLTPREIDDAIYHKNRTEESKLRAVLEVLRLQTYWGINKYKQKGEKRTKKEVLMLFPWDEEPKRRLQTADEMKQMMKALARSYHKGELKRRTTGRKQAKGIPDKERKK